MVSPGWGVALADKLWENAFSITKSVFRGIFYFLPVTNYSSGLLGPNRIQ